MKEVMIIEILGSKYPLTLHTHSHTLWFSMITCILMHGVSAVFCDQKPTQSWQRKRIE